MTKKDITAKRGRGDEIEGETCSYNFGDNLDESVKLFGKESVHNGFAAQSTIALQSYMRSHMNPENEGGATLGDKLQKVVDGWKPGAKAPGISKQEKAKRSLESLSPEDRAAILAEFK